MNRTQDKKAKPQRGGRPSKAEAERLNARIVETAAALFFAEGYGATSMEAIARAAAISKRTLYARYPDKAALFQDVVKQVVAHVRPPDAAVERLFHGPGIEATLANIAQALLRATLSAETLALHRVIVAEAVRFPELGLILSEQPSRREAIARIAALLEHELRVPHPDSALAAEQFLMLVVSAPQRRALGIGKPMTAAECDRWASASAALFLDGCRGREKP